MHPGGIPGASVRLNSKSGTGFKNRISNSVITQETSHHHLLAVGMVENLPEADSFRNQEGAAPAGGAVL